MRRPVWWSRRGLRAWLVLPIGLIYALIDLLIRLRTRPRSAPLPLICIGNLTVGGAGKTPMTQALVKMLADRGFRPAIISRGYGRKSTQAIHVDPKVHDAGQVGDEPLLHAINCPTYVGADRLNLATMAAADGAQVLLLDDGLQHHRLRKDFCLEVRHKADGLGNGFPLPAGPLRQWFGLGSRSVDLCLLVGQDAVVQTCLPPGWDQSLDPDSLPVAAFCGIADPNKFKATLFDLGIVPDVFQAFGDHHAYSVAEVAALIELSKSHRLLTTQKDWVRLPPQAQSKIAYVPYALSLKDPEGLWAQIAPILSEV